MKTDTPNFKQLTKSLPNYDYLAYAAGSLTHATRKKMSRDPQIALALSAIKAPVIALDWTVSCDRSDVAAFITEVLRPIWAKLVKSSLNALDFGFQAHEKIFEIRDVHAALPADAGRPARVDFPGAVVLVNLKDIDPAHVVLKCDTETGKFAGFAQKMMAGEIFIPKEKAFIYTHDRQWGNLYGHSILDNAYDVWFWTSVMYKFCNRYFERKGDPPIVGRAPAEVRYDANGTEVNTIEEAAAVIHNLKNGGTAVFPDERDDIGNLRWDFHYLLDDKRADQFLEYIRHLEMMKLRALLVPERTLTQEDASGSYALAKVHTETFLRNQQILVKDLFDHINRYIVRQLVEYNFGATVPRCEVVPKEIKEEDTTLLQQLLLAIFDKHPNTTHYVDILSLLEKLNIKSRKVHNKSTQQ